MEYSLETTNLEQRVRHPHIYCPRTLKVRRSLSPTTLRETISSTRAIPGNTAIQYSPDSRNSKPLAIRRPAKVASPARQRRGMRG